LDGVVRRTRRYYLLLSQAAHELDLGAIAQINYGQQLSEPGILLPDSFPALASLQEKHYFTAEDVDGADCDELACAGVSRTDLDAALAQLVALGYGLPWNIAFDPNLLILKPLARASGVGTRTTPVLDMGLKSTKTKLDLTLNVEAVEGSAPVLAVALQTSSDLETWDDLAAFSDSTTDGKQILNLRPQRYVRADWSVTGTDSVFLFSITGKTR